MITEMGSCGVVSEHDGGGVGDICVDDDSGMKFSNILTGVPGRLLVLIHRNTVKIKIHIEYWLNFMVPFFSQPAKFTPPPFKT